MRLPAEPDRRLSLVLLVLYPVQRADLVCDYFGGRRRGAGDDVQAALGQAESEAALGIGDGAPSYTPP